MKKIKKVWQIVVSFGVLILIWQLVATFGGFNPVLFPQIASSLHLALSTSWIFLVSGEMVGSQSGLGFLIMDTKNCIRSDALLATMITIGAVGLLLDRLIGLAESFLYARDKIFEIFNMKPENKPAPEYFI